MYDFYFKIMPDENICVLRAQNKSWPNEIATAARTWQSIKMTLRDSNTNNIFLQL